MPEMGTAVAQRNGNLGRHTTGTAANGGCVIRTSPLPPKGPPMKASSHGGSVSLPGSSLPLCAVTGSHRCTKPGRRALQTSSVALDSILPTSTPVFAFS